MGLIRASSCACSAPASTHQLQSVCLHNLLKDEKIDNTNITNVQKYLNTKAVTTKTMYNNGSWHVRLIC